MVGGVLPLLIVNGQVTTALQVTRCLSSSLVRVPLADDIMNNCPLPLAGILLAAQFLPAQSYTYAPDAGYGAREGAGACYYFGCRASQRVQLLDDSLRNKQLLIRAISFRPEFHQYTPQLVWGRSWTQVRLDLSYGDTRRFGTTFSTNSSSTPTRVFASAVSWPDVNTKAWQSPGVWSLSMGLTNAFVASKTAVLADFSFDGGVLNNLSPWPAEDYYALDSYGYDNTVSQRNGVMMIGKWGGVPRFCVDGRWVSGRGAYAALNLFQHGPHTSGPQKNTWVLHSSAHHFAPQAPAILALGGGLIHQGIAYPGIICQRLYLDPRAPLSFYPVVTDPYGFADVPILPRSGVPIVPGLEGVEFAMQGIWSDSVTAQARLSMGAWCRVPFASQLTDASQAARKVLVADAAQAGTGLLIPEQSQNQWSPILRYTH